MEVIFNLVATEKTVTPEEHERIREEAREWINKLRRESQIRNLLELIRYHRKHCHGDCSVSLWMLKPIYERLVGRDCTEEELNYFI